MHHIRHETAKRRNSTSVTYRKFCNFAPFENLSLSLLQTHTYGDRNALTASHCLCFVTTVPSKAKESSSTDSCSSPLCGLPHSDAIVSVEVGGQLLWDLHAVGLDHIREAQRPEGQSLHGLLHQLDVTTSTCCICLDEIRREEAAASSHTSRLSCIHEESKPQMFSPCRRCHIHR